MLLLLLLLLAVVVVLLLPLFPLRVLLLLSVDVSVELQRESRVIVVWRIVSPVKLDGRVIDGVLKKRDNEGLSNFRFFHTCFFFISMVFFNLRLEYA